MQSISSLSTLAIGELPNELDASEPSLFAELLQDPEADIIYLIELNPYAPDKEQSAEFPLPFATGAIAETSFNYLGGVETVYISDRGYLTEPTDSPANTSYLPLTDNPFQFEVSILNGEEFRGGAPSFGAIRLKNGDKELDYLMSYYWGGRAIKVFAGSPDFARADFVKVFDGVAQSIESDEEEIIINLTDKQAILENNFAQNYYAGTGGLEGSNDLEATPKPLAYGNCKNVPLTLVDRANLIYQVHDGSIEAIDKVYDRGVELTADGDVSDITAASVTASNYKTQLSGGYIKLGSAPDGQVTADVRGDNAGGYVDKVGSITSRLLRTKLDISNLSDSEIDQGALNGIDLALDATVGVFLTQQTNLKAVIDSLFIPLQCYWTFSRLGMFTGGVLNTPSSPVISLTEDDIEEGSLEVLQVIPPSWRVSIEYGRSWLVQGENDLAAAALSDHKDFVSQQYRKITTEDRTVRGKTASAKEVSFATALTEQADASTQISRVEELYREQRKVIRVTGLRLLFRLFIGDVINLQVDRFGLNSGKNFLVTSVSEDIETDTTTLELWG